MPHLKINAMKTTGKKNIMNSALRIALGIALLFPVMNILAQEYTKNYEASYPVDKGASLVIVNKFGDVNCTNWEESKVAIVVTVKVEASSQEKADRVLGKISVELSGDRTKVQGITKIDEMNNASDFSVNYEIRMPDWINLDFNCQFGDIYVDESNGSVKIRLDYGAMEAISFGGTNNNLTLKFSDGEVGFMKEGEMQVEYSEFKLKGTEKVKFYSRFSEVHLVNAGLLNLDSQYDEIEVEQTTGVISVSRFSELDFGKITGDFDFDTEYGDIEVDYIAPVFKVGKVRNSFAGANLTFDPKASFNLDAELQFGDLSYPKAASMNHITEGYTTEIYKGRLGSGTGTPSQLTIISKNADASISFSE